MDNITEKNLNDKKDFDEIKRQYEKGILSVKDISNEDIEKLKLIYKTEIEDNKKAIEDTKSKITELKGKIDNMI